ncbi:MAG: hypothetical protein HFI50_01605 [Lachnospiraceae bacterium]|jgi:hypothetical protein|nr:hypothetical protein [Lachnospiraceae bacterium]
MSDREKAMQLLNAIDDERMVYVVGILENLTGFAEVPNAETLAAFTEVEEMERTGAGQHFSGSTEDFFKTILEED